MTFLDCSRLILLHEAPFNLFSARYDRKFEEEYKNYNPFGKGGGGAPMRDQRGNVVG